MKRPRPAPARLLIALFFALGCARWAPSAVGAEKPNIVFILADDLGWTDLACQGSKYYETPNIDRLAARSMRFQNHHHCQNCTPTRAALLCGQYPTRTGIYTVNSLERGEPGAMKMNVPQNVTDLPLDRRTIGDQAKAAGYATGYFGKWHVGLRGEYHPAHRGFDEAITSQGRHFDFKTNPPVDHPEDAYLADWLTDRAVDFIDRHRAEPFFLHLAHFAVHSPFEAKPELIAHFEKKAAAGGHGDPVYAAMIASLDESVGRVLAALESAGLAEKTAVIFTSDNGGVGGYGPLARSVTDNSPLRGGKGQHYEGGLRVPLFIRWPGVTRAGAASDVPTVHVDLFATLLEISGAPAPPQTTDGLSLVPLLRDPAAKLPREAIYGHLPGYLEGRGGGRWRTTPVGHIIAADWKLLEFYEEGRLELYNLRDDPGESRDLAASNPDKVRELQAKLVAWRAATGALMPSLK